MVLDLLARRVHLLRPSDEAICRQENLCDDLASVVEELGHLKLASVARKVTIVPWIDSPRNMSK